MQIVQKGVRQSCNALPRLALAPQLKSTRKLLNCHVTRVEIQVDEYAHVQVSGFSNQNKFGDFPWFKCTYTIFIKIRNLHTSHALKTFNK
jgi:hypothetical protein